MSVQSIPSPQDPSRLGIAFVTALFLHGAAFAALTLWPSGETVAPPGEQEITIDLAPAMEEIASVAPAEVSAQAAPPVEAVEARQAEEAEAAPPEEVTALLEPEQVTEAVPVEAVPEAPPQPDAVVALPPPETVEAEPVEEKPVQEKPAPKPVRKPPPAKPVERKPVERKPEPRRTVAAQQPPSEVHQGQASASRENTGGAAASADPNALNRYVASLASALRNRLRYPDIARNQGIGGIATLRFTMDRSGRILSASIVRSAGHPALDQSALTAARPGSSLPPAPPSLPQQQFTFSVPLRFDLR